MTIHGLDKTVAYSRVSATLAVMAAMDHQIANVSFAWSTLTETVIRLACVNLCGTMNFIATCHMHRVHHHVRIAI